MGTKSPSDVPVDLHSALHDRDFSALFAQHDELQYSVTGSVSVLRDAEQRQHHHQGLMMYVAKGIDKRLQEDVTDGKDCQIQSGVAV